MTTNRTLFFAAALFANASLQAQHLSGHFDSTHVAGQWITLSIAHGTTYHNVDSVRIEATGEFSFPKNFNTSGYYQLALADDQFDLLLDAREPEVNLVFNGLPMQEHVQVRRSDENQRLWEYKFASRQAQAIEAAAAQQKLSLQPTDTAALAQLDSISERAERVKQGHLQRLLTQDPSSLFTKTVKADLALISVMRKTPNDVAKAFDLSDPELMRSSMYDKAVMVFLQNMNPVNETQFSVAADTLMALASKDPECKAYMMDHMIDLFATYGPESALQHVVDTYYVPANSKASIDPEVRAKVEKLMLVSVGRTGPDITLDDHGTMLQLAKLAANYKYTALFFYSSTCSHCHDQLPTLKRDYELFHDKGFNVLGIALDEDSTNFLTSIVENMIPWPCYSEFIGWGAKAVKAYQVKATPTFYLLDDKLRIVAKPNDAEDLRATLRTLLK